MFSCKENKANTTVVSNEIDDNLELLKMFNKDQADRSSGTIDWNTVSKNDSYRRDRVYQLLDSNKVKTSLDYYRAALIFQHGNDTISSTMAVKMMKRSIRLDSTGDKWLLAAAIDRDLMRKRKPQIFGTQFIRRNANGPWERYLIDTTKVTDEERKIHGVETLKQQREKELLMNKKRLNRLLSKGKSIIEIISFIRNEDIKTSDYNVSESGVNRFGYNLMMQGLEEDASKIFELNIELHPGSFNVYDSYGEFLLKNRDTINAIKAYEKSLELNSKNTNAQRVLSKIVKEDLNLKVYGVQINVLDIDQALDFYSRKIGFEIKSKTSKNAELENKGIKLFLNRVSKLRNNNFPKETRTSLSLHTNNLDSLMTNFKSTGLDFVEDKVENGVGFASIYQDPFGNKINFMEQSKFPVSRFNEPKIYNVGLSVDNLEKAKKFYCEGLGFRVRSTKFLPALPMGYKDGTFAFMLHKKNVRPTTYGIEETQIMMVFCTSNIKSLIKRLKKVEIEILTKRYEKGSPAIFLTDPFGNMCKIIQVG